MFDEFYLKLCCDGDDIVWQKLRVSNDCVKQCSLLLFQTKSNISLKLAYLEINH